MTTLCPSFGNYRSELCGHKEVYEQWGKKLHRSSGPALATGSIPARQSRRSRSRISPQFQHFKLHLQQHMGSPVDTTAEKCCKETPVSHRNIRVSPGPRASSWLPPQAMGNRARPISPHLASPRNVVLDRALPPPECAGAPSTQLGQHTALPWAIHWPISAGSWLQHRPAVFWDFPCSESPPGPDRPQQRPKPYHCPD